MIWLQLKKNGVYHTLDLAHDASIPCEVPCDLLSLEFEEVERTYAFKLPPTPANIRFFGAPQVLKATPYAFQEFEAILGHGPNVFKTGYFKLTEIGEEYQGFLKGAASALSKVKDTLIGDLVSGTMIRLFYLEDFLNDHDDRGPVVFPTLLWPDFYKREEEKIEPQPNTEFPMDGAGFFNYYSAARGGFHGRNVLAVPRLLTVLEEVLLAVGYEAQFNFTLDTLYDVLLLAHQAGDNPFKMYAEPRETDPFSGEILYSETLPHLTVSDFLRSLRINFGMKFTYGRNGVCEVDLIRDLVKSRKHVDITQYVVPVMPRQEDVTSLKFTFAEDSTSVEGEDLASLEVLGPVMYKESLPAATYEMRNHCRLVLAENRYYVPALVEGQWAWRPTVKRFFSGLEGETDLESKIVPVDTVNEAELVIDTMGTYDPNSNGWLLDPLFESNIFLKAGEDEGKILFPDAFKSDYSPFGYNINNSKIVLNATLDGEIVFPPGEPIPIRVSIKKKLPFYVPLVEGEGSSNFYSQRNDEFKGYMALYHGLTERRQGVNRTVLASASNYDSTGARKFDFALRFTGDDGLVSYFWEDALAVLGQTERVKANALLPISFLRNFDSRGKLRIHGATFLPTQLRYNLTSEGVQEVSLELRQLRNNAILPEAGVAQVEGDFWIDFDDSIITDGDEAVILAE